MGVHHTAGLTAVWRCMGSAEKESVRQVGTPGKIIGYLLGWLDPASVSIICERTLLIDSLIRKIKPKAIVEIGSGYSSRPNRFPGIKFYQLDLPYIAARSKRTMPFDITKDSLNLKIKSALFIVEGVTMYLAENHVKKLLREISKYNGSLIIDFFNSEQSRKEKSISEKIYKLIFRLLIGKPRLFDFRIKNMNSGKIMLKNLGYKNIKNFPYSTKSLGTLFYAQIYK